jgi:SAM-dependent methyltransferase
VTAWSSLNPSTFLREGLWSVGQGVDAPDRKRLRAILTELEPCSLLDVGCGTGIDLDGIRAEGLQVEYTGMDLTPEFVDAANARHPSRPPYFYEGDVFDLRFERVWDVVSARAVLEHVLDGPEALRRLWASCRRVLVVSFFIAPGEETSIEHTEDGFIQQTYRRADLVRVVKQELRPHRFTTEQYEHAGQNWSQWVLWR